MVSTTSNRVYLYVGYSKTNQFGSRDLVVPIPGNTDPVLDPVRHIQTLFSRVQSGPDTPAFSFSPTKHVTYDTFTRRLKSLLVKAGYSPNSYSGHSFRRGGATFLHACGGTALMVQASGDWSVVKYLLYPLSVLVYSREMELPATNGKRHRGNSRITWYSTSTSATVKHFSSSHSLFSRTIFSSSPAQTLQTVFWLFWD